MAGLDVGTVYVNVLPQTTAFGAALQAQVGAAATAAGKTLNSNLTAASSKLTTFGKSMTRYVSLPIAAAGVASIKLAADFDQSMRNVNSILGLSGERFDAMSKSVLNLSTQVPQSADTLAAGLYDIASSGFQGAKAMEVLDAAARAASAGMTDTATASKSIVAVLNAYGLGAQEAAEVSDTLFQGVNIGVETFSELSNSLGSYIGAASQLAVPLEDVIGAQAAMTLTGISAAESATSLNGIFKTLLKPSEDLAAVLKEAGFASGQVALEQEGLQGVMELLSAEVGNNKGRWVELFPEIRAARGAMALASDDGKLLGETMDKMGDSVGAASNAFDEQMKGASARFTIAMNNLRKAGIQLGNQLIPVIVDDIIPAVKDAVKWFSQLSPEAVSLGVKLMGAALVAGPLIRLGGALTSAAGGLAKFIPWLLKWPKGPFPVPPVGGLPGGRTPPTPVFPGGLGTAAVVGAGAFALGSIDTVPTVEGLEQVDNRVAQLSDSLGVLRVSEQQLAFQTENLNWFMAQSGENFRVNADLLRFAIDNDISYSAAIKEVGAAYEITSRKLQDQFLPVLAGSVGLTEKEKLSLAGLTERIGQLGGGLSKLTQSQLKNLGAMGDAAAMAAILRGRIDALRAGHQAGGKAADEHAGKVRNLARDLLTVKGNYVANIQANTGPANAAVDAFIARVQGLGTLVVDVAANISGSVFSGGEHGAFIPGAAAGGFVFNDQILRVGERNKGEMILPLEDRRGHEALVRALAAAGMGGSRRLVLEGPAEFNVQGVGKMTGTMRAIAREEDNAQERHRGVLARMGR